jgi:hypothetical protein
MTEIPPAPSPASKKDRRIRDVITPDEFASLLAQANEGCFYGIKFKTMERDELLVALALQHNLHLEELRRRELTQGVLRRMPNTR